jgi:phosphoglycolate phosphatase
VTRAVLFDLDDTLIASTPAFFATLRRTARELGLAEPDDERLRVEHTSWEERIASLFPGTSVEGFDAHYHGLVEQIPFEAIPGAVAALHALRPLPLGIVTNRGRRLCDLRMQQGGVPATMFEFVLTVEDLPAPKPDPAALVPALERLAERLPGLAPEEVCYVGDRVLDAQAAAGAGVAFVAVLTGTESAASFAACGVPRERMLPSVVELPRLLASLSRRAAPSDRGRPRAHAGRGRT